MVAALMFHPYPTFAGSHGRTLPQQDPQHATSPSSVGPGAGRQPRIFKIATGTEQRTDGTARDPQNLITHLECKTQGTPYWFLQKGDLADVLVDAPVRDSTGWKENIVSSAKTTLCPVLTKKNQLAGYDDNYLVLPIMPTEAAGRTIPND